MTLVGHSAPLVVAVPGFVLICLFAGSTVLSRRSHSREPAAMRDDDQA